MIEAAAAARRLLELGDVQVRRAADLTTGLEDDENEGFVAAVERLARRGAPFRMMLRTRSGALIEAIGATEGFDAAVRLEAVPDERAAFGVGRRAETQRREFEDLKIALSSAQVIAWRAPSAGAEPTWLSDGAAALPDATRRALIEGAGGRDKDSTRVRIESDAPAAEAAGEPCVYDVATRATEDGELIMVAADVREAEAAKQALNRFVYTMSETFAHLRVGLMIFDGEARLSLFNPAIIEILKTDVTLLARRPSLKALFDEMREARTLPEQADYFAWRKRFIEMFRDVDHEPLEEVWHLPDGRALMVLARPHPTGGLAIVIEDITESLALRRLNASERAVRYATTDLLQEALIVFGPDGRLRMSNSAFRQLWGYDAEPLGPEIHISDVAAHCSPAVKSGDFWSQISQAATTPGDRAAMSGGMTLADGRMLSARLSPMPDGSILAVFADVTASARVAAALKERNEALEHAEEMRTVLIDQISHQMRTPLNSIFGFGQLLGDERFGALNPAQRDYVLGIVESSSELLDAIDGMADLISIGAEAPPPDGAPLDVEDAMTEVVELARRRFDDKRCRIELDASGLQRGEGRATPTYRGDRVKLRQIMFNMMMDALGKSPIGGVIVFSAETVGGRSISLKCAHPVDPEAGEQGLALALVRRFARLSGGEIEVAETNDGRRTIVCDLSSAQGRGAASGDEMTGRAALAAAAQSR